LDEYGAAMFQRVFLFFAMCVGSGCGTWNDCKLETVVDTDSVNGFDDFWNAHVKNESRLNVDTGADMTTARFFRRWASIFTQSNDVLAEIASNCAFGILTVILQALPAVEYEDGRSRAVELLEAAQVVWSEVENAATSGRLRDEAELLGWDVRSIRETLLIYESTLRSTSPSTLTSGCGGVKFFVYPPPALSGAEEQTAPRARSTATLLRSNSANYFAAFAQAPLQCLFGMYGTELLFHLLFASPDCSVSDPETADLFFVPSYFKCVEVVNYADHFNAERHGEDEADLLFRQTMAHVRNVGPWFDRSDGADHVLLFSWGRFPCRLPRWREAIRSAMALQVEDHCEDINSELPTSTFSRWKDVVIPGHIDKWRVLELQRQNRPSPQRDVLLSFHGRHAGNTDSYGNVTVRSRILELEGLPGVSVGGFVEDYHELLGMSIFCLAPRGITPWTIHLYVAMLAGCIPVILSDNFELPFQDYVDWPSFSVRWPESSVGQELYHFLLSIPVDRIRDMKEKVDMNSCWFNYYSGQEDCSPHAAVVRTLRARHLQRPTYVGKWWPPAAAAAAGSTT